MKKIKVLLVHSMHPEETLSNILCNKVKEYFNRYESNFEVHVMNALDKIETSKEFLSQREIKLNLNRYIDFKNLMYLSDNLKNIYELNEDYDLVLDVHNSFGCKNCILYSYTNKNICIDLKNTDDQHDEDFFKTNFVKRLTKFQSLATFLREEKFINAYTIEINHSVNKKIFYEDFKFLEDCIKNLHNYKIEDRKTCKKDYTSIIPDLSKISLNCWLNGEIEENIGKQITISSDKIMSIQTGTSDYEILEHRDYTIIPITIYEFQKVSKGDTLTEIEGIVLQDNSKDVCLLENIAYKEEQPNFQLILDKIKSNEIDTSLKNDTYLCFSSYELAIAFQDYMINTIKIYGHRRLYYVLFKINETNEKYYLKITEAKLSWWDVNIVLNKDTKIHDVKINDEGKLEVCRRLISTNETILKIDNTQHDLSYYERFEIIYDKIQKKEIDTSLKNNTYLYFSSYELAVEFQYFMINIKHHFSPNIKYEVLGSSSNKNLTLRIQNSKLMWNDLNIAIDNIPKNMILWYVSETEDDAFDNLILTKYIGKENVEF